MSLTINYCDIELEHYLQILVNKHKNVRKACWESQIWLLNFYFTNIIDKQTYFTGKLF